MAITLVCNYFSPFCFSCSAHVVREFSTATAKSSADNSDRLVLRLFPLLEMLRIVRSGYLAKDDGAGNEPFHCRSRLLLLLVDEDSLLFVANFLVLSLVIEWTY